MIFSLSHMLIEEGYVLFSATFFEIYKVLTNIFAYDIARFKPGLARPDISCTGNRS
jgi:hypothetical protein